MAMKVNISEACTCLSDEQQAEGFRLRPKMSSARASTIPCIVQTKKVARTKGGREKEEDEREREQTSRSRYLVTLRRTSGPHACASQTPPVVVPATPHTSPRSSEEVASGKI
jgi:hypothetical protein